MNKEIWLEEEEEDEDEDEEDQPFSCCHCGPHKDSGLNDIPL